MANLKNTNRANKQKGENLCLSKQQTSPNLINSAFNDRWIDSLAFYHLIKRKYRNSRIYDYTAVSLSNKLSISPYLVSKYVNQLRDLNMVRKYGKALQFISIYKIKENIGILSTKKCTIWLNEKHNISDIKAILTAKYLEFKGSQQVKRIDDKIDQRKLATGNLKGYSYEKIKRLIKISRNIPIDESIEFDIRFSYNGIANELQTGKSTVFRLIQKAKELNKIKITPGIKKLLYTEKDGITFDMFKAIKDLLPDHAWYNKLWHSIVVQMPNQYNFIEYKIEPQNTLITN